MILGDAVLAADVAALEAYYHERKRTVPLRALGVLTTPSMNAISLEVFTLHFVSSNAGQN